MSQPLPPVIHNTQFPSEWIRDHVAAEYTLSGPVSCEFIRRGFNDHYLISTSAAQYVYRVYYQGKYYISGADDFRFELELLAHVQGQGVPVAAAVPTKSGELLGHIQGPEGTRYTALFEYVEGRENADLVPVQAHQLGQILAQFHAAADTYHTSYSRYHFDLSYLVERPIALIRSIFHSYSREAELEPFLPALAEAQTQILRIPRLTPTYGAIHGDPHSGNYHLSADDRITLFDFDHAGYGWRAYDVAVCKGGLTEEAWQALLQGYQEIRPLMVEELEAIPAFRKVRPIWDEGDVLAMYPVWGKSAPEPEFCDQIVALLRKVTA